MAKLISLQSVTTSELATILHGLRLIQEHANGPGDCSAGVCEHFADVEELTDAQIDNLAECLSFQLSNHG
jgi:hypothetical protein